MVSGLYLLYERVAAAGLRSRVEADISSCLRIPTFSPVRFLPPPPFSSGSGGDGGCLIILMETGDVSYERQRRRRKGLGNRAADGRTSGPNAAKVLPLS